MFVRKSSHFCMNTSECWSRRDSHVNSDRRDKKKKSGLNAAPLQSIGFSLVVCGLGSLSGEEYSSAGCPSTPSHILFPGWSDSKQPGCVAFLQSPPVAAHQVQGWIQTPWGHRLWPLHHPTLNSSQSGPCHACHVLCAQRCPWLAPPLPARPHPYSSASLLFTPSPCPSFRASASLHLGNLLLSSFFLFWKMDLFGCPGSLLMCGLLSRCGEQGLLSRCGAWALEHSHSSNCSPWAQSVQLLGAGAQAVSLRCTGLVARWHAGPSRSAGGTCVSCIGRWSLYPWATREAPLSFLITYLCLILSGPKLPYPLPSSVFLDTLYPVYWAFPPVCLC